MTRDPRDLDRLLKDKDDGSTKFLLVVLAVVVGLGGLWLFWPLLERFVAGSF